MGVVLNVCTEAQEWGAGRPLAPGLQRSKLPEHSDEGRDASRLEDSEQSLPVVGEVVQDACGAPGCIQVTGVLHGAHHSRHQLGRAHEGTAGCLLLGQLVHNHSRLGHHYLEEACEMLSLWLRLLPPQREGRQRT